MDKKFGNYLYKHGFATVTTKNGACLESDPVRNRSGFNLSAQ